MTDIEHLGYHSASREFDLMPQVGLGSIPAYRLEDGLRRMLIAANNFPVWGYTAHNPDKTPVTGVCANCRKTALKDMREQHEGVPMQPPTLAVCWYAAVGQVLREHKCSLDVCGCGGPHKE